MKKGERLQQLRELTGRDIEYAQHGGCTDYYCDCHLALPECLDEIEWLQARNRDLLAACKRAREAFEALREINGLPNGWDSHVLAPIVDAIAKTEGRA